MISSLIKIKYNIEKANKTDKKVQNLAHLIDKEMLAEIHQEMDGSKAPGIDMVIKEEYGRNLSENLDSLIQRMKTGAYQPKPSRRAYIPKDGSGKMRPLGISSYEDKLVESAVAKILVEIYEPKFYDFSYGFRPGRNCHMAIRNVLRDVQKRPTNYIVEADIRSFFDTVNHEWLMKMLEHDIADKRFMGLVQKFLEAGVMEAGKYFDTEVGTPQGNSASAVLANVYLHYVLDNWFDVIVRRQCRGFCGEIRYADDFACCFEYEAEAEAFLKALRTRIAKYGLELAEEKTRILEFGRYAAESRRKRNEGKPETFNFLGFTFYCSMDARKRYFRCKVKTAQKKFISKVRAMKEWIMGNRNLPLEGLFKIVNAKLEGHYNYYGVTDNSKMISRYAWETQKALFKWLNRRSQRQSYTWYAFYYGVLRTFPLAQPRIKVSLY